MPNNRRVHMHKTEHYTEAPSADIILQWHDWTGIGATLLTGWALEGLVPEEQHLWHDRAYMTAHLSALNELWEQT